MARLRVALVGAGIGDLHLTAFLRLRDRFEVTVICDRDEARAERLGATLVAAGEAKPAVAGDFRDPAVTAEGVDVVDVCLPPFLHGAAVTHALGRGKHVICEKPLVGSLAEADALAALAAAQARLLMPVFQYRFGNGIARAKHLIDSGVAGKAYVTTIETHWTRGPSYYAVAWRGRRDTELGGVLAGHAIHAHDMVTYLLGPVRSVSALTAVRVNPVETEDCAGALFEMADGSIAVSSATLGSADEITRLRLCCENVTMVSNLAPYVPNRDPWTFIAKAPADQAAIDTAVQAAPLGPEGYTGQFGRFHDSVSTGCALPVTFEDGRGAIELLGALYHSARTGQRVVLPIAPEHPAYKGWTQ